MTSQQHLFDVPLITPWSESLLRELFRDITELSEISNWPRYGKINYQNSTFNNAVLKEQPSEFLIRYYTAADPNIDYWRHIFTLPCPAICYMCLEPLKARWVGRSSLRLSKDGEPKYFESEGCVRCYQEYLSSKISFVSEKWQRLFDADELEDGDDGLPGKVYVNLRQIRQYADKTFASDLKFYEKAFKVEAPRDDLIDLFLKTRPILEINEKGELEFEFTRLVVTTDSAEGEDIFFDWAISHITAIGSEICRNFQMQRKFIEDLRPIVIECNYFDIHYSTWRAGKEAAGQAAMSKRPREDTFLRTLHYTLQSLQTGKWQVNEPSKYFARRDCPDSFWNLVRLKDHNLSSEEVMSFPIGLLWEAICESESDMQKQPLTDNRPSLH
jgi:hypothetical protein